ncbi:cytochrome P450 [Laetiporus sulphureus 93-53]|uniref:Cytochrome P450 n=1 Tax=Laetiporus sulphureus 93-53 TaxID=1314785 RepID=A0A165BWK1_9APHY|nr:cytochrome P450 [Laetiporus sulphureus 93-53]KZT01782.1 cytochrome P450 [Laetiporus sulphureus 93-53]
MIFAYLAACFAILLIVGLVRKVRSVPLTPRPHSINYQGASLRADPWRTFANLSKAFGPLYHFSEYGRHIVVVNSPKAISDLLKRRSALYGFRPGWSIVGLTGLDKLILFADPRSEKFKKARAIVYRAVNTVSQDRWGPLLEDETKELINNLSQTPEQYQQHIRRYMHSFVLQFVYGLKVTDRHLQLAGHVDEWVLQSLAPGRWILDRFPFLDSLPGWLPGMGFKSWSRQSRQKFDEFTIKPYMNVRASLSRGMSVGGIVGDVLQEITGGKSEFDEATLQCASASTLVASTSSMHTLIARFLLHMTTRQDVQEKAYAEIIKVIGTSRLPTLADQRSMPYINAVIKECHRFSPVVPLLPRSLNKDDIYDGRRIPGGSWVLFNLWAIAHDPEVYPDPDTFDPERFMCPSGSVKDPRDFTFGLGKRICPGANLGNAQIFLFVSQVLSVFQIKPALDADGNEEIPPLAFTATTVSAPQPFNCRIIPRKESAI